MDLSHNCTSPVNSRRPSIPMQLTLLKTSGSRLRWQPKQFELTLTLESPLLIAEKPHQKLRPQKLSPKHRDQKEPSSTTQPRLGRGVAHLNDLLCPAWAVMWEIARDMVRESFWTASWDLKVRETSSNHAESWLSHLTRTSKWSFHQSLFILNGGPALDPTPKSLNARMLLCPKSWLISEPDPLQLYRSALAASSSGRYPKEPT